jgi:hypothetical protein
MPTLARLRKLALGMGLRIAGTRLGRFQQLLVRDGIGDLIGDHLPGIFGVREIDVSISIGRELRPNLKPVLQILTRDGRTLGYAKLGWNDVTRALVENEASVLRAWGASRPASFRVPEILHTGTWEGLDVLVVSPMPHPVVRRVRGNTPPDPRILREVASLHGTRSATLSESSFFGDLLRRVAAIESDSSPAVQQAAQTLRAGETSTALTLGTWHGDWAPWNMTTTSSGLHVWDWERSAKDVPVGLDALHFGFEVTYHKFARQPVVALESGVDRCHQALDALGLDTDVELLRALYVLERFLRVEEGRSAGVPVDERLRDGLAQAIGGDR